MKDKMTRFLAASLASLCVLCIAIFTILAFYMSNKSTDTIKEVGDLYMAGLNKRITMHFGAIVDYHVSHLNTLVEKNLGGDRETLLDGISDNARVLNLKSLALYSVDGDFESLYGEEIQIANPQMFLKEMLRGNQCVAAGSTSDGETLVLIGIPYICDMSGDRKSVALVGGIAQDYFAQPLALNEEGEMVFSHIIRKDGTFVVKSGDAVRDNCFDRIAELYDRSRGGEKGAEELIRDIRTAMNFRQDYSGILPIQGGDKRHLYITRLPDSDWYLMTVMPYGALDEKVRALSGAWGTAALVCCLLILVSLILIFSRYFAFLRRQMQALREAQEIAEKARGAAESANKAKSEFLSNMSHDIRTPMNAIVGMTAIATANIDNQEYVKNCLRKITLSSRHLLGLINDVLDMSKIESGKMTLSVDQVSLREVMDSLVSISQPQVRAKEQIFNVVIQDIITENVCCDSVRLNQVLLNLLSNAIKYTQKGGEIRVQIDQAPSPNGDKYVRTHFQVKDNGIGMPEEFIDHIFDSFAREDNARVRKTEGTGLGMAITKYIIDTMGGQINVDSTPGVGSTFDIVLDLERSIVQEESMILPNRKILVVDDDPLLCESAGVSLKEIGMDADWAMTGSSAVEMVEAQHRTNDDYHIILIDWKLPDCDGLETARKIRKCVGDNIPILLISTYDWSEIEEEAYASGINGFIAKPLFKSTLFYGLKKYCMRDETVENKAVEADEGFKGRRILVAEDNELNWEIANELLSELGLELEWAEDGKICVDKFEASPVGYYDAILMDIRMPVMTGYDATHAIRRLQRTDANVPIIAMTADAFAEDIKKCLDSGMNAHVAKPIDMREVVKQLKKYIK